MIGDSSWSKRNMPTVVDESSTGEIGDSPLQHQEADCICGRRNREIGGTEKLVVHERSTEDIGDSPLQHQKADCIYERRNRKNGGTEKLVDDNSTGDNSGSPIQHHKADCVCERRKALERLVDHLSNTIRQIASVKEGTERWWKSDLNSFAKHLVAMSLPRLRMRPTCFHMERSDRMELYILNSHLWSTWSGGTNAEQCLLHICLCGIFVSVGIR